ncbi:MAG TPA: ABC transporter permease, partial [Gemmatimonadaceae bacterium]|nr:ABC transporter permease [Gemmatimonadaceae bacterium]
MWHRRLSRRLRALFRRADIERDLAEEFRFHIEHEAAELAVLHHLPPDEARRRALLAFGGVEKWRESHHDARGTRWLEDTWRDVTLAVRSLRRNRGFAVAVVLTLALGIGLNTAMFTVLRGTLLRSLPNRDGQRLVYLRQSAHGLRQENQAFSVPEVADYRGASKTLSAIAEYSSMTFTLVADDDQPVHVRTGIISGNYFDVMGLEPVAGRLLNPGDDGKDAASVAVLSHPFWMQHFGGDPRIVGRTLRINDQMSTIVGVVQPAPLYPQRTDVFVNTVTSPHHLSATMVTNRTHRMSELFARLAPDSTLEQARAEIGRIASNVFRDHPETYDKASQYTITVSPLRQALNERASLMLWLLMGAAGFVLLIACANVANLTLMRGVKREREMLVRAALGAGRWRLRRLLLVENLTLALLGGALGVLVAFAGLKMLVAFAAQLTPRADEIRVDGVVLAVGLATSVAAAVALSFVSRIGRESVPVAGRVTTLSRGRQRFQQSLVIAQIAVCMVLLTGAGLLVRTIAKLQAVETGVRVDHVLTLEMPIDVSLEHFAAQQAATHATFERVRNRVAALPGVQIAGIGSDVPLTRSIMVFDVKAEGRAPATNEPTPRAMSKSVDPHYFEAAGMPLLAGRGFGATDGRAAPSVAVLNKTLAEKLFGNENPIGRRVAWTGELLKVTPFTGDWRTVVGVVGDTRDEGLDGDPTPTMFLPFAQGPVIVGALIVRTKSDPVLLQSEVVRTIREIAPQQLIEHVATLEQVRDQTVAPRRLNALFIVSFGTLALVIAMVGIAGVLAFSVSSRTSEIGIRMSFGADAGRVRRMILGEGGVLLAAGLAVGLAGALFAARLLRGLLFGVTPNDPTTLGVVALVLGAIGVAACWLPAA